MKSRLPPKMVYSVDCCRLQKYKKQVFLFFTFGRSFVAIAAIAKKIKFAKTKEGGVARF